MFLQAISLLVLVLLFKWYVDHRPKGNISGYMGVPLLGVLPFLGDNISEVFTKWSYKLGPVYYIFIGTRKFVVLNTYSEMKEFFVKCSKYTSGRPTFMKLLPECIGREGLMFRDDNKQIKIMSHKLFRRFVTNIEENLRIEISYLNGELQSRVGSTFNPKQLLLKFTTNTISKGILGSRMDYDEPVLVKHTDLLINLLNNHRDIPYVIAINLCYWLRHIPPFTKVKRNVLKWMIELYGMYSDMLENRRGLKNSRLIDECVLDEILQLQKSKGCFTDHEVRSLLLDIFIAGSDTTAVALYWCLLYLTLNPHYQEQLHQEVTKSGEISYERKRFTPKVCSFLDEILRHRTIVPCNEAHRVTETFQHNGITLYKDDSIMGNIWAINRDPQHFNEPNVFKPERFIINGEYTKSNFVPSFGMGPRMCLGTKIAEMEMYMVLCNILKTFKLVEDSSYPLPSFEVGVPSIVYNPIPFQVKIVGR